MSTETDITENRGGTQIHLVAPDLPLIDKKRGYTGETVRPIVADALPLRGASENRRPRR